MTDLLNESLQDLGETFATNLTNKGVTSSASEGLTTLANKILNINAPGTITLTSNKTVINYDNSETATLTATYSRGAGYSLKLYNAVTGSKIGNMVDNGDGTYSYTYNSTGNGDISITATKGITESNSITIEDCMFYDDASSDNKSRFSFISNPSSASLMYNNNHYYYVSYSRTPESNPCKFKIFDFTCEEDFEVNIDVYYTSQSTRQFTFKVAGNTNYAYQNMSEIGTWSTSRILRTFDNSSNSCSTNPFGALPSSTWLTFKVKRQNGTITMEIYNGNSLLNSKSCTAWSNSSIIIGFQLSEYMTNLYFKNIKVKLL